MKRGQPGEGILQASRRWGLGRIGRSRQPGSDLPESSIVLLDRAALVITDGNGRESQVSRHEQPAMDPLDVISAKTVRWPGAKDQGTLSGVISPQSCPAESTGTA